MKKIICVLVLLVLLTGCGSKTKKDTKAEEKKIEETKIYLKANKQVVSATLIPNSTSKKLIRKLQAGDITITMADSGGYEKIGELKFGLPTNEQNIKALKGDIMLYKDNQLIICYDDFFLNLTKVGKIDNPESDIFSKLINGSKDIEVTISLNE